MARPIHLPKPVDLQRLSKPKSRHHDGGGLYLRVVPPINARGSTGTFSVAKERTLALGSYPAISLARAREKAADARSAKADGKDPVAERHGQRVAARVEAAKAKAFKQCAEAYIKLNKVDWKNAKHADQWEATLESYVYPQIGSWPVGDVDVAAVLRIVQPIWESKSETASRIRGRIETVLALAPAQGFRSGENPAAWSVPQHVLPKKKKGKNHAALAYADLPAFMALLRERNGISAKALEFTILTAARTTETIGAPWSETEGDVWTVTKERMKAARDHRAPLCARAARRDARQEPIPLSAVKHGHGELIKDMNAANVQAGRPEWVDPKQNNRKITVHGLGSTFSDWITEETEFARETRAAALFVARRLIQDGQHAADQ